jgi:serine/threonine-protein kinase
MGAVYRAVRADEAFEKVVALKVIKRGLHLGDIVRRFHQERRALAGLDHPYIGRLLDGGSTPEGLPYFVMEYVDGEPIDRFCDGRRLTIDQRLPLFRKVCEAVEYAHRNLVVHRDIKPDNILVLADGTPKLLDFGLAKLLSELPEVDAQAAATRLMTPDYASPEQIQGRPVSTSTDIYSLGVLLYRLLTGRRPYDISRAAPLEAARVICDTEPVPASAAAFAPLSASGAGPAGGLSAADICERRNTTPRALRRRLEGDLDTIVAMAMRKEPERRYRSVDQFSDDVGRHLAGLPVLARRDTIAYRTGKFVKRHAPAVALAAALLITLMGSTIVATWQARIAGRARDRATGEAAKAAQVTEFLEDMLASAAPGIQGRDVRVADVLDAASTRLHGALGGEPETKAALLTTIGKAYLSLGLYDPAEKHLSEALGLREKSASTAPADLASTLEGLGAVLTERGEPVAAEPLLERALALYRQAYGPEHPDIAGILNRLGSGFQLQGRTAEAERVQRESLAMRRKLLGRVHRDVADSLNDLAVVLGTKGDFAGALQLHREALDITRKVYGADHPDVASTMINLAYALEMTGDDASAETMYRDAVAMRRKLLGNEHPETAWAINSYAGMLFARGDYERAEHLFREILTLRGHTLPDTHPMTMSTLLLLGRSLAARGRLSEAEPVLQECLALRRKTLGRDHFLVSNTESIYGEVLLRLGQSGAAGPLLRSGYSGLLARLGPKHQWTVEAKQRLAELEN